MKGRIKIAFYVDLINLLGEFYKVPKQSTETTNPNI